MDKIKIVMFMSPEFTDVQRTYHTMEREILAVIKCLTDCRWLKRAKLSHYTIRRPPSSSTMFEDDFKARIEELETRR